SEKCDLVILLTHCGFNDGKEQNPDDCLIAKNTEGVDIIIGGHSHTFIKKPAIVESKTGKKVMVVQAGCKGEEVGRIDIWF
ncbi:MAG: metallophosphoesterase, partial [Bacteroidales bacterium]|nr:metallophosphoesterase [Bacteroidales bacterium]